MKFAVLAWVAAATCLVVVCGQPTTEEDGSCSSPDISLKNVARQTTLSAMASVLNEVKNAVVKPNLESLPQINNNPIFLLKRKTKLFICYLFIGSLFAYFIVIKLKKLISLKHTC